MARAPRARPAAEIEMAVGSAGSSEFERVVGSALAETLRNQESIMLHIRDLLQNEEMRIEREEVLEKVLASVKANTGKRERNVSVS